MSETEEDFIPYLVLVRFDKDGGELKTRLKEAAPALKEALADMGAVQAIEVAYDGSMAAYLVAARPRFENALQVLGQLQSPHSHKSSPLIANDKVLVVSIEQGSASRLERTTSWLRECNLLVE
jgi:hypothetical protein